MNAETQEICKEIYKEYEHFCYTSLGCRDCDFHNPLMGCKATFFVDYMITKLKEHSNEQTE